MHSRIYELKDSRDDENELTDDSFETSFYDRYGIDYISGISEGSGEYKESIDWLASAYKDHITFDETENSIIFSDIPGLMEDKYNAFKAALEKLKECSLEDFAGCEKHSGNILEDPDASYLMWQVRDAWCSDGEFYIYHNGYARPLFTFLRDLSKEQKTQKFYIGSVLDYHY